jgi:hypothetical protein
MTWPGNRNYLDTVLRRSELCGKLVPVGPSVCVGKSLHHISSSFNNNNNNNNNNATKKQAEKILIYKDLTVEIQRMWNVKTNLIPVIIGATGTISNNSENT